MTSCHVTPPDSVIGWVNDAGTLKCEINGISVGSLNQGNGKFTLATLSAADQATLSGLGFAIGTNGKWETESF